MACTEDRPSGDDSIIDWVRIKGGEFDMGETYGATPHHVVLQTFYIARSETTFAQYLRCVEEGVCEEPSAELSLWDEWRAGEERYSWQFERNMLTGDVPVHGVSWRKARTFCNWAGGRLPSEFEWEFAARSRATYLHYPWGLGWETDACWYAVVRLSWGSEGCGEHMPWPVCLRSKGNSEQDVCCLCGNVREWTEDDFHPTFEGAPADGSAWVDSPASAAKVVRGSDWDTAYTMLAVDERETHGIDQDRELDTLGFRCARATRQR